MTTTDTCRTIRDFSARSIPSILRSYCAAVLLLFVFLVQTFAAAAASPAKPDIFLAYKKCQWEEITSAEEKRKICTLLAESCEANYSKLATWQATYQCSGFSFESTKEKPANIHHLPPDYQDYSVGQVEFSLDFRKDLLNWKYQCAESVHTKEPESVANFPVPATVRHVTPEESTYQAVYLPNSQFVRKSFQAVTGQIHTMPGYSLSEQNTAYVHARNDIRPSRFSEHTGDPRHFYCSMKGGDDQWYKLWSRSSAMQKVFDEKKEDENSKRILERTKISRSSVDEDTLYKMTTLDRNGDIFQDFIHSAKDGFNLVYFAQYFAPDDAVGIAYAMEFTESDGVMIPKYYAHFHGPGGFLTEYQLQESKLNGKLPDDIFTVQALGLKDNDIVVDFQEKVNYMLKNGQLVKLSDFGETPSMETLLEINKPKSSFFGKTAFIVFNILLIALGIYLLFYRKKLKKGNR